MRPAMILLLLGALSTSAAAQIFVHPAGDDSNPGTFIEPLRTPGRALLAARARIAAGLEAPLFVYLRGGTHRIQEPLVFGPKDGGDESFHVTWKAFPGESPVLSGGREITGWKRAEDGSWRVTLSEVAAGRWHFRELFVNGRRAERARHPNDGWLRVTTVGADRRTSFGFEAGTVPACPEVQGLELIFLHDWSTSRIPVAALDSAKGELRTAHPIGCAAPHYAIDNFEPHPRFALENHRALLDAPGEWHLDAASGELCYLPRAGEILEESHFEVSAATRLMLIRGGDEPVRNLRFSELGFRHCAFDVPAAGYAGGQASLHESRDGSDAATRRGFVPAAIHIEGATELRLRKLTLEQLGGSAIWIGPGCHDVTLDACTVRDVGANGINVGEDGARQVEGKPWWQSVAADAPEITRNVAIRNCTIERCGQLFGGAVGIWIGFAQDTVVTNNELRELPYTGVSVGWVWNPTPSPCRGHRIERNHIHHVMQLLSDGGGIYTLGLQPGTVLRGNDIHDVPLNLGRAQSNGIFVDEGSTEIRIEGNFIHDLPRSPIRFHRAGKNLVIGNVFGLAPDVPPFFYNRTEENLIEKQANLTLPAGRAQADAIAAQAGPQGR